jgi:hypothetical protein
MRPDHPYQPVAEEPTGRRGRRDLRILAESGADLKIPGDNRPLELGGVDQLRTDQRVHPGGQVGQAVTDDEVHPVADEALDRADRAGQCPGQLYVSLHTVKTHMRHIYAKLGVHRRSEAVERARELGLLAPSARRR